MFQMFKNAFFKIRTYGFDFKVMLVQFVFTSDKIIMIISYFPSNWFVNVNTTISLFSAWQQHTGKQRLLCVLLRRKQ